MCKKQYKLKITLDDRTEHKIFVMNKGARNCHHLTAYKVCIKHKIVYAKN
jgi:hypothetical protein